MIKKTSKQIFKQISKNTLKHTSSILCMLLTIALISMPVLSAPVLAAEPDSFGTVTALAENSGRGIESSIPFKDVPKSAWYYDSVCDAYATGLINGKTATTFSPADNMTVAEALKLASCMHQLDRNGSVTLKSGSVWYEPYFEYCYANGIISEDNNEENGYYACLDRANQNITREEYALFFSRALPEEKLPEVNIIPDDSIPDVPTTNSVYNNAIYKLYRSGIVNGSDSIGTFNPYRNITRSEVAAVLVRMMNAGVRVGAPSSFEYFYGSYGDRLCTTVLNWYDTMYGYRPAYAEVVSIENNDILIHLYDDAGDHISTAGWYIINPSTLQGFDYLTGEMIDFSDFTNGVG